MNHKENIIGRKFYRLTVIAYADDYVSPKGKHWTSSANVRAGLPTR